MNAFIRAISSFSRASADEAAPCAPRVHAGNPCSSRRSHERPAADLGDSGDDSVEEEAVVRDEDDGVRILREILLEPVARFQVEVVGRFVEQQQAGTSEQQLRQRNPHLPAARKVSVGLPRSSCEKPRPRAAPSRSSDRCCSPPRGGTSPEVRCTRPASLRVPESSG